MSKAFSSHAHPLDPLSIAEIQATVQAVRAHVEKGAQAPKPIGKILFNSIDLREPNKHAVLAWSGVVPKEDIIAVGGDPNARPLRQSEVSQR